MMNDAGVGRLMMIYMVEEEKGRMEIYTFWAAWRVLYCVYIYAGYSIELLSRIEVRQKEKTTLVTWRIKQSEPKHTPRNGISYRINHWLFHLGVIQEIIRYRSLIVTNFVPLNNASSSIRRPLEAPSSSNLCLDIRLSTSNMLLELQKLCRKLDIRLQEVLRILAVRLGITAMLLDVQADRGS
jgi:hypothetical protein